MDKAFHLSLNVRNLKKSVDFYQNLLGVKPLKSYEDYAKFELNEPPLVLSLEPTSGSIQRDGTLNHLGIRVAEQQMIREYYERAAGAGIEVQWMSGVECCYSRQSKIVAQDPDGNLVEFYTLDADLDRPTATQVNAQTTADSAVTRVDACADGVAEQSWTHLLGTELQVPISVDAGTQSTINLRGTLNNKALWQKCDAILKDAGRSLTEGGKLSLHLLVADRELTKPMPTLPAPAQHVEFVPVLESVIEKLNTTGFANFSIERLSHAPVFAFDGVEMRELLLTATMAHAQKTDDGKTHVVVYRGPMREIALPNGPTLKAGIRANISAREWDAIKASSIGDQIICLTLDSNDHCGMRPSDNDQSIRS
jgi:catechol 2,3-dioxygenase-like lactoylglutathione lyase family enzyme